MINKVCLSVVRLLGRRKNANGPYQKLEISKGFVTATDGYRAVSISIPDESDDEYKDNSSDLDLAIDAKSARKLFMLGEKFYVVDDGNNGFVSAHAECGDIYRVARKEKMTRGFRAAFKDEFFGSKSMHLNVRYLRELLTILEKAKGRGSDSSFQKRS